MKAPSQINQVTKRITLVLFIIYLVALCWILLFKLGVQFSYMQNRSVNLIPFKSWFFSGKIDAAEVVSNIIVFVPLGIYTCMLFTWSFAKKLFFFFSCSLFIEMLQLIFAVGAFDTTDIVTNTVGGIIGWMLYKAIEKVLNSTVRTYRFINVIAIIATASMLLLLVLLKMNMLPIKYQ